MWRSGDHVCFASWARAEDKPITFHKGEVLNVELAPSDKLTPAIS
jgi:hypothetical protein